MRFDGFDGNLQIFPDFLIAVSKRDIAQHFRFATG